MTSTRLCILVAAALTAIAGCGPGAVDSATPFSSAGVAAPPSAAASTVTPDAGSIVIVGRIVTMGEPPVAEALLIEDGTVAAVGTRDEVLALAGDQVPVMDIGENVAYPGFIDAHAHWIGDRELYGVASPAEAMDAALKRGWTSISEQWVNPERLDELERLAADDALPLRVDAYLALNFGDEFLGDWYADHERGPVGDRLRVQGLKIHLDNGEGTVINWEPTEVTDTIGRANAAGWQVSVHTVSTEAMEMVLDAYEAAHRAERSEPAPPSDRARHPGVGRPAGPDGRDGPRHRDPPGRRRRATGSCGRSTSDTASPDTCRAGPTGSPAGATSWTPGCTSPPRPTCRGSSWTPP